MSLPFQGSLLDVDQASGPGPLTPERTVLAHGAWIDVLPGWLGGADALFDRLAHGVPWQAERRVMYDRVVDVPRLLRFYEEGETLPDPVLAEAGAALNAYYAAELGEPFRTAGLCFYRDGRDSVAWHGDTIGRGAPRTRWSPSSRSARHAACCCARAVAGRRSGATWDTATSS